MNNKLAIYTSLAWYLTFGFILTYNSAAFAQLTTTVNISNDATTLLRDVAGAPLSQGMASVNQDGMRIELGFYTNATTGDNFNGSWVSLLLDATIGDSSDLSGAGDGIMALNIFYFQDSQQAQVYDPDIDPGQYLTSSAIPITTINLPQDRLLAIRFFDTTDGLSGGYNTVSSDSWLWQVPTIVGSVVSLDLASSVLEWEDPTNAFRTSLVIPEPSSYTFISMIGLSILHFIRRKRITRNN